MMKTIKGVPVELKEVLGNLIRKTAYTQLRACKLIGFRLSKDSEYVLPTELIDGKTVSMIDLMVKLSQCQLRKIPSIDENDEELNVITIVMHGGDDFADVISEYVDSGSMKGMLKVDSTFDVELAFMRIKHDTGSNELRVMLQDGFVPIPCRVFDKFRLDYGDKDEDQVSFEIDDASTEDLTSQLLTKLNFLGSLLSINN